MKGGISYSLLNIFGLTISLVISIYIFIGIQNEMSYDNYSKRERMYRLVSEYPTNTGSNFGVSFPGPLAPTLKAQLHGIENYCRIESLWIYEFIKNEQSGSLLSKSKMRVASVDASFFDFFDIKVLEGDKLTFFNGSNSIVLAESIAQALFGNSSAYGKTIVDNMGVKYNVTGIVSDFPNNSSLQYNIYMPFKPFLNDPPHINKWEISNFEIYLLLKNKDTSNIIERIKKTIKNNENIGAQSITLQQVNDIHLHYLSGAPNDILKECKLSFLIGIIILLISSINYINLSISRSSKRNKELFIKLIYGASRKNLFLKLLIENIIIATISIISAGLLLFAFNPFINSITSKDISINIFSLETALTFLSTFILIVVISGIYPAYILSKQTAVNKMIIDAKKHNATIRRFLTFFQFAATAFLIISSISITKQLNFMKNKDLGYNPDNLIYIELPPTVNMNVATIKNELAQFPDILSVASASSKINNIKSKINYTYNTNNIINARTLYLVDSNFLRMLNIKLIDGEMFKAATTEEINNIWGSERFTMPDHVNFIINEATAKLIGVNCIGKNMKYAGVNGNIIGVVKDFHMSDLKNKIEPLVIVKGNFSRSGVLYVKLKDGNLQSAIRDIERVFKKIVPDFPFTFRTIKDDFTVDYENTLLSYRIINLFTIISIIISCIGLLGFIGYSLDGRKREIAICKVVGANMISLVWRLQKEYIYLALGSMLIAFPLAYFRIQNILNEYAFHIPITWHLFFLSGVSLLLIVVSTILYKTIKTASINPVEIIKQNN
ncbi:MAG: ABC transporter permease [Bacteroidales bacterium]